jgi:hypothetical protein
MTENTTVETKGNSIGMAFAAAKANSPCGIVSANHTITPAIDRIVQTKKVTT